MGKSKKTRWRTFSFDGSKDETQINGGGNSGGGDVKVNGTSGTKDATASSQKYSQILGDHHTNYLLQAKASSTAPSNNYNNFKARSYNKENYYNQRSSTAKNSLASKNSWQRGSAFHASASGLRDTSSIASSKRLEENGRACLSETHNGNAEKQDFSSQQITAEPIKFNEDEYTRITTPRQDVLFKKGYLSRMNSNKTANTITNTSSTVDSTVTTATNSDPESSLSVSTLSPATTPSMEYGQMDQQDFASSAPVYYPGYYDESGMLVFPMYNGYNYYPPNGSTSPVYLMPYPYQYDPFFMAPNTEVAVDNENTADEQPEPEHAPPSQNGESAESAIDEKAETNDGGVKENNQISTAEEQNNDDDDVEKDVKQDEQSEATSSNELNEQTPKQCFPIYANELGYVYPYANGYFNGGFYYYNGVPATSRPPRGVGKRRKRYSSSRSSHSYPPPPRSTAETTTDDYSDDDGGNSTTTAATTHSNYNNRRFYSRYSHNNHHNNGWNYHQNGHHHHHHHHHHHSNGYNSYHYNKYHARNHIDHNANQTPAVVAAIEEKDAASHHESGLNADVVEFYPRVHSNGNNLDQKEQSPQSEQQSKHAPPETDLEKQQLKSNGQPTKSNAGSNAKPSHSSKSMGRVSKKEIMDGIKLMEQQNINLKASSKAQLKTTSSSIDADVEWNVVKKGKKVKIVKDSQSESKPIPSTPSVDGGLTKDSERTEEVKTLECETVQVASTSTTSQEIMNNNKKTTSTLSSNAASKSKKTKSKGKKKKLFAMLKQDGFEIIEPVFSANNEREEIAHDASEGDDEKITVVDGEEEAEESEIIINNDNDNNNSDAIECEQPENKADEVVVEGQFVVEEEKPVEVEQEEKEVAAGELSSDETRVQEILTVYSEADLVQVPRLAENDDDDTIIDISDEEICRKTSIEIELSIAQEMEKIERAEPVVQQHQQKKKKKEKVPHVAEEIQKEAAVEPVVVVMAAAKEAEQMFADTIFFSDCKNIAELERDLMENLRILDDGIDIKSPVINPLYDFPITSAVRKWLQEKQHESFENLFRVENFKKLSELYDECEDDDDESDISDSPQKSETTDSDYASDIQIKQNGSPASSNAKLDTKLTSKCNNKLIVKESFCALM